MNGILLTGGQVSRAIRMGLVSLRHEVDQRFDEPGVGELCIDYCKDCLIPQSRFREWGWRWVREYFRVEVLITH